MEVTKLDSNELTPEEKEFLYSKMFCNEAHHILHSLQNLYELFPVISKGRLGLVDRYNTVERQLRVMLSEAKRLTEDAGKLWQDYRVEKKPVNNTDYEDGN